MRIPQPDGQSGGWRGSLARLRGDVISPATVKLRALATGLDLSNRTRPNQTEHDKDLADYFIQNVERPGVGNLG